MQDPPDHPELLDHKDFLEPLPLLHAQILHQHHAALLLHAASEWLVSSINQTPRGKRFRRKRKLLAFTMAGLIKPKKRDWRETNMAFFGSDTEKQVSMGIMKYLKPGKMALQYDMF